jgi:hypothetical protein
MFSPKLTGILISVTKVLMFTNFTASRSVLPVWIRMRERHLNADFEHWVSALQTPRGGGAAWVDLIK